MVLSMRLSMCASTTPPPPKLTVRAARFGNVVNAHERIVSGDAARSVAARSRTSAELSMGCLHEHPRLRFPTNTRARFPLREAGPIRVALVTLLLLTSEHLRTVHRHGVRSPRSEHTSAHRAYNRRWRTSSESWLERYHRTLSLSTRCRTLKRRRARVPAPS